MGVAGIELLGKKETRKKVRSPCSTYSAYLFTLKPRERVDDLVGFVTQLSINGIHEDIPKACKKFLKEQKAHPGLVVKVSEGGGE